MTDDSSLEVVHCGGCNRRSLLSDAEAAGHSDEGPDGSHCPRCGTRINYHATTIETYQRGGENDAEYRYLIRYADDAGRGGKTSQKTKTVRASSVEVSDGLLRFLDASGTDRFAIDTNCVITYTDISVQLPSDDEEVNADAE